MKLGSLSPEERRILFSGQAAPKDARALAAALDHAEAAALLPAARIQALRAELLAGSAEAADQVAARTQGLRESGGKGAGQEIREASGWLSLQAGPPPSSQALRVRAFLRRAPVVRVSTENGSNLGHQQASVAVLRELRELGYAGALELLVPPGAEEKMRHLLPGYDPRRPDQTLGPPLAVRVRQLAAGQPEERPGAIGVVAASDHDERRFAPLLGVGACVVLQPYDWPGVRRLELAGRPPRELSLPSSSTYVYAPEDPLRGVSPELPAQLSALGRFFAELLPGDAERQADLLAIMRGVLSGKLELLPAYGMHAPGMEGTREDTLRNLVGGLRALQAQSERPRPAVLLEIAPEEPPALALGDHHGRLGDGQLGLALRRAAKDQVFVLRSGALPRPIFELLYRCATLPAVLEGANTSNLMQLLGKPFLTLRQAMTGLPEAEGPAASEGLAEVRARSDTLSRDEAARQLDRLRGLLTTFVQTGRALPPPVMERLAERIAAGEALAPGERALLERSLAAGLARARPTLAEEERRGFAELVAASLESLTATLAALELTPETRRAIAHFDPGGSSAAVHADSILQDCRQAVDALLDARLGRFLEEARTVGTSAAAYFAELSARARAPENRQLLRGLDALAAAMETPS